MTVKEHYDTHLGKIYSWMAGDFKQKSEEFLRFLEDREISPQSNGRAVDLGAGHGIQSLPLAKKGYRVTAIDFNEELLNELRINAKEHDITTVYGDIRDRSLLAGNPELILCCGDTLAHLADRAEIQLFLKGIASSLTQNGKLILSFRDYSNALHGTDRIIPVASDENRILTCILDYDPEFVTVTDLYHERIDGIWKQKASSYRKVRIFTDELVGFLEENGFRVTYNEVINRLTTIIAVKV